MEGFKKQYADWEINMKNDTKWDVMCLGRASVDLYAEQIGARLEDVSSFAKYIGGSSLNIATGTARLGLKSALITKVGNEQFGAYIVEQLQKEGVDTSQIGVDDDRLTAIAILAIKNKEQFPLLFYRENCADASICADDINEAAIADSKVLLITGTHLSAQPMLGASLQALEYAKKHSVIRCLDIDYRPVLWGLTPKGDGDTRFVADNTVTAHLQSLIPYFDLIVGTDEEIHIAGGTTDTLQALKNIRNLTNASIVLKRGASGASVYEHAIPDHIDGGINSVGVQVEVLNVLGAGDAFMSGFLRGYIVENSIEKALQYGNASGALVVSRHGCTPAMPTWQELSDYLHRQHMVSRPDQDTHLNYLHRVTASDRPIWRAPLSIFAFDHRIQMMEVCAQLGVDENRITYAKQLMLQAGKQVSATLGTNFGVLIDETFGQDALNDATGDNIWVARPVELPRSYPLQFERGDDMGTQLKTCPKEHIIKCLMFYHPDGDADINMEQLHRITLLWDAVCVTGHELLLEIIHPEGYDMTDTSMAQSLQNIYDLGIKPDWWKLPTLNIKQWQAVSDAIDTNAPHCRGVLILGLGCPLDTLSEGFVYAKGQKWCKGFAIGRTIFGDPLQQWLSGTINDTAFIQALQHNYTAVHNAWQQAMCDKNNTQEKILKRKY